MELEAFLAAFDAYMANPLATQEDEDAHAEQWDAVVSTYRDLIRQKETTT